MKLLKESFPEDIDYRIAYDTTPFIRDSVNDVQRTLLEAVGLVAIVVLVFLQSWRGPDPANCRARCHCRNVFRNGGHRL